MRVTEVDTGGFIFIKRREGSVVGQLQGGMRVCKKIRKYYMELQEAIKCMNEKRSRLLATTECKQKLMSVTAEEVRRKVLDDVVVVEDRISAVEMELLETSEERVFEKRNTNAEGGGFRTLPESVWMERRCMESKALKVMLDLQVRRAPRSSGPDLTGERLKGIKVLGAVLEAR